MSVNSLFRKAVYEKAPPMARWALDQAIEHHESVGQTGTDRGNVVACISLAGTFRDLGSRRPSKREERVTPEGRRLAHHLMLAIAPSVGEVRMRLFGDDARPFPSLARAVAWIDQENKAAQARRPPRDSAGARAAREKIQPHLEELSVLSGVQARLVIGAQVLVYQRPTDRFVSRIGVRPDEPLDRLRAAAHAIAEATGFAEDAVVSHILAGQPLELRAAQGRTIVSSTELPDGTTLQRVAARIDINARDVTDEELRKIYRQVRKGWRGSRTRGLTEKDAWLLATVEKLGGVPAEAPNSKAFWERVWQLATKAGAKDESWRTVMMRARRLREKLLD